MKKFKVLIPEAVADAVSYEHFSKLMEIYFALMGHSSQFSRRITDTEVGRDRLHASMSHWLEAYNKTGKWLNEQS